MNIKLLSEPPLQFGTGEHIDPKTGIITFNPYDLQGVRPERIKTGIIGKSDSVDTVIGWLNTGKRIIAAKKSTLGKLFPEFCGFSKTDAFKSEIIYDEGYIRKINNSDFDHIIKNEKRYWKIIEEFVTLYINEIKFLAKNKNPDVILCVLSEKFIQSILGAPTAENTDAESASAEDADE